jgi:hypothetical protein
LYQQESIPTTSLGPTLLAFKLQPSFVDNLGTIKLPTDSGEEAPAHTYLLYLFQYRKWPVVCTRGIIGHFQALHHVRRTCPIIGIQLTPKNGHSIRFDCPELYLKNCMQHNTEVDTYIYFNSETPQLLIIHLFRKIQNLYYPVIYSIIIPKKESRNWFRFNRGG